MAAWTATLTGGIHPKFRGPLAVVDGPMGERIAEVPADPGQDPMPRAHTIAAAPDLLAKAESDRQEIGLIVEDMVRLLDRPDTTFTPSVQAWKDRLMVLWSDRAAIAKAKGAT